MFAFFLTTFYCISMEYSIPFIVFYPFHIIYLLKSNVKIHIIVIAVNITAIIKLPHAKTLIIAREARQNKMTSQRMFSIVFI